MSSVRISTGRATRSASGWITSIVPASVTTPRPPPNARNTDLADPIKAAVAATTSIAGLPPLTTRATSTGTRPFRRSPTTTSAAPRGPSARSVFVAPVRPDPIVRGSGPPVARATRTPTGTDPHAYPNAATRIARRGVGPSIGLRRSGGGTARPLYQPAGATLRPGRRSFRPCDRARFARQRTQGRSVATAKTLRYHRLVTHPPSRPLGVLGLRPTRGS